MVPEPHADQSPLKGARIMQAREAGGVRIRVRRAAPALVWSVTLEAGDALRPVRPRLGGGGPDLELRLERGRLVQSGDPDGDDGTRFQAAHNMRSALWAEMTVGRVPGGGRAAIGLQ